MRLTRARKQKSRNDDIAVGLIRLAFHVASPEHIHLRGNYTIHTCDANGSPTFVRQEHRCRKKGLQCDIVNRWMVIVWRNGGEILSACVRRREQKKLDWKGKNLHGEMKKMSIGKERTFVVWDRRRTSRGDSDHLIPGTLRFAHRGQNSIPLPLLSFATFVPPFPGAPLPGEVSPANGLRCDPVLACWATELS